MSHSQRVDEHVYATSDVWTRSKSGAGTPSTATTTGLTVVRRNTRKQDNNCVLRLCNSRRLTTAITIVDDLDGGHSNERCRTPAKLGRKHLSARVILPFRIAATPVDRGSVDRMSRSPRRVLFRVSHWASCHALQPRDTIRYDMIR